MTSESGDVLDFFEDFDYDFDYLKRKRKEEVKVIIRFNKSKVSIFWTFALFIFLASLSVFSQEKRLFLPEDLLNLKRLSDPQISPSGDWVAFVVTQFGEDRKVNSEIWIISKNGKILKRINQNPGYDHAPRWSADGKTLAFLNEKLNSPKEIWISSIDGKGRKQLTNFNDYLKEVKLGKVETIRWMNPKDTADVEGIVVKPVNFNSKKRYPLLVWLHGGPAYNWSEGIQLNNWAQLFATQGYLVFLPNFRGSSGHGMKWMMANVNNWGEGPMSDIMTG